MEPAENSESDQYALLVRNVKCYSGRRKVEISSIVVQSEPLKKFLADVMEGYPGLTLTLERIEFQKPLKPFVHRWESFCKAREQMLDPITKAHVDLLYRVLEGELLGVISRKNDLVLNGVITHNLLWTIFEPGAHILAALKGHQRGFTFSSSGINPRTKNFEITAEYIDFDGDRFGSVSTSNLKIPPFEGTSPITSLPVFPLVYHSDRDTVRRELIARGKLWKGFKGYHYRQYEGIGITNFMSREVQFSVNSRIIIDADAFKTFNPDNLFPVYCGAAAGDLTDDELLIATPVLRGYSLNDKRWLEFFVNGVQDITWNTNAFDSLVLPRAQQGLKELILAFAKAHPKETDSFDDVVRGKGRGVIILLSGPPGVGKTLTAESVAEVMKVPLYVLSAGELGTKASTIEDRLKDVLSMIPKWGAVLLIDEADVFMETRHGTDLQRNELVSIFLRMLEYYQGILFLTSNRAEHIDPAFESRIDVSLRYPDLDKTSRRQIWSRFIESAKGRSFSDEDLDKLAAVSLNGRQIKNVLKTANLLAREQETALAYGQVQTVLKLRALN